MPLKASGFTTVILGMLHIGNPVVKSTTRLGDIIFNGDEPLVIRDGTAFPLVTGQQKTECLAWPDRIAALKSGASSVTKVFASVGGGGYDPVKRVPLVRDFESIKTIYDTNGNTFDNSVLERNFTLLRTLFPAIDGIDMDCEETYDHDSFVAFCEMLIRIGFEITFCPYTSPDFWVKALDTLNQKKLMDHVKWWNLQCYDGGVSNQPDKWVEAIQAGVTPPPPANYIVPGLAARFLNNGGAWDGDCPEMISNRFSIYPKAGLAGGFIWEMDLIIATEYGPNAADACSGEPRPPGLARYAQAVKKGLGG